MRVKMKKVMWKGNIIPAEIAALGAGADAGSRQLKVYCDECGTLYKLCDSDSADICQDCFDMAGLQNEIDNTSDTDSKMPTLQTEMLAAKSQLDERRARSEK